MPAMLVYLLDMLVIPPKLPLLLANIAPHPLHILLPLPTRLLLRQHILNLPPMPLFLPKLFRWYKYIMLYMSNK